MVLDIKVIKKKDYVYLVELNGPIDTETHQQLEEELKEIIDEKTKAVMLDMAGVAAMLGVSRRTCWSSSLRPRTPPASRRRTRSPASRRACTPPPSNASPRTPADAGW